MFILRYLLAILLIAAMLAGCAPAAKPDWVAEADTLVTAQATPPAPEKAGPVVEPTGAPTVVSAAPAAAAPTAQPTLDPNSPRATIEAFYTWYFSQPRGEVITERSYNDYPQMTDIQKSDLNYLLDSFKDSSGYDPFICAQNDLPSLTIAEMFVSGGLAYALAEVIIDGQVQHYFVVTADRSEGPWKIGTIFCPRDPQTAAIAFYTWYLGYIYGDQDVENGGEILRNPIVDKAYRRSFLVSEAFVNKIEAELAAMQASGGMADPILNAQNLPIRFTVQPLGTENMVAVRLDYDVRSARYHNLVLVETLSGWIVDDIQHVVVPRYELAASPQVDTAAATWEEYKDEAYGFSLRFPRDWAVKALDRDLPADDPVKSTTHFFAPGLNPDLGPALWLDVFEGSEGQLINAYVTEVHQEQTLNGATLWIDRERCNTRFVFRHPQRENTWIVIGDQCPSRPGNEGYARALAGIVDPLLRTITFW